MCQFFISQVANSITTNPRSALKIEKIPPQENILKVETTEEGNITMAEASSGWNGAVAGGGLQATSQAPAVMSVVVY